MKSAEIIILYVFTTVSYNSLLHVVSRVRLNINTIFYVYRLTQDILQMPCILTFVLLSHIYEVMKGMVRQPKTTVQDSVSTFVSV